MTKEKITECVGRMSLLRFFPANPHAIAELARIINDLCVDDAEGERLTDKALLRFDQWPGPVALRAFYWEAVASRKGCAACGFHGMIDGHPCTCSLGRYWRSANSSYRPWVPPQPTPQVDGARP